MRRYRIPFFRRLQRPTDLLKGRQRSRNHQPQRRQSQPIITQIRKLTYKTCRHYTFIEEETERLYDGIQLRTIQITDKV